MIEKLSHCSRSALCLVIFMALGIVLTPVTHAAPSDSDLYFIELQQRLVRDGFNAEMVNVLYRHPDIAFETRSVSLFFIHSEGKLDYDQFSNQWSISRARKYMQKHTADLERIEKEFGVDKTVITAIILVETGLGTVMGKSSTLNALSSLAALKDPAPRERFWKNFKNKDELTRKDFNKKAARKSAWAYRELKAFLEYTQREDLDPQTIYGSYAGAMGIPQFMPTNIAPYARDGSQDGTIDLFNHADAMASIASYLKTFGWKPGITRAKKKEIVHRYNHSSYYVDTILKISDLLKK